MGGGRARLMAADALAPEVASVARWWLLRRTTVHLEHSWLRVTGTGSIWAGAGYTVSGEITGYSTDGL